MSQFVEDMPLDVMTRDAFVRRIQFAFNLLEPKEHLLINQGGENSQFVRVNGAKIRQIGSVRDLYVSFTLIYEGSKGLHKFVRNFSLTGHEKTDQQKIKEQILEMRKEVRELPVDSFAELPKNLGSSDSQHSGGLLKIEETVDALLEPAQGLDLVGIYAGGVILSGVANSAGQIHWFETETFSFDFSIYTPNQKAVKACYAGTHWDHKKYVEALDRARKQLEILEKAPKKLPPQNYRVYLAPAASSQLIAMFSWAGISEAAIRQGASPFRRMRSGEKAMSPKFSVTEDFKLGMVPQFNELGELSADQIEVISQGKLSHTLVSSRTALEYQVQSNAASSWEHLRSPRVGTGQLREEQILERLGTGIYVSNLHYLNWSDHVNGRITGMTRYACYWVENGKPIAPIENLRFDDSIFELFGDALEDLTEHTEFDPELHTYEARRLGGIIVPGILLKKMAFTL